MEWRCRLRAKRPKNGQSTLLRSILHMARTDLLGGRLPLLAPSDLSSDKQKQLYERMRTHQVPWAEQHNFLAMTDDERLIGPFNPLLYSPGVGAGFLDFEAAEDASTSLDDRVRQVVILS